MGQSEDAADKLEANRARRAAIVVVRERMARVWPDRLRPDDIQVMRGLALLALEDDGNGIPAELDVLARALLRLTNHVALDPPGRLVPPLPAAVPA